MKEGESKTIVDFGLNGKSKVVFFGIEHFKQLVAKKKCCFICGAFPASKEFNDEHVVPDWILKEFKLHDARITLPNGAKFNYSQYKIPCCKECNAELGEKVEKPISQLLKRPYHELVNQLRANDTIFKDIYHWLCLIYFKTHLADNSFHYHIDRRKGQEKIADFHYWGDMHHIHCMARKHHTNAKVNQEVYGTLLVLPALKSDHFDSFDYIDSLAGRSVMVQLGEICLIAVLDDSWGCYTIYQNAINKIDGPLSHFQMREIIAHLNFININLKDRPSYYSSYTPLNNYKIGVKLPEVCQLVDEKDRVTTAGEFLYSYVKEVFPEVDGDMEMLEEIRLGKRNFLFDEKGDFINHYLNQNP